MIKRLLLFPDTHNQQPQQCQDITYRSVLHYLMYHQITRPLQEKIGRTIRDISYPTDDQQNPKDPGHESGPEYEHAERDETQAEENFSAANSIVVQP